MNYKNLLFVVFALIFISANAFAAIDTTNLAIYWKLDETSGTTILDAHGTTTGTYTSNYTLNQTGLINKAPLFSTGYASISNTSDINYSGDISVSAWIKTSTAANQVILSAYGQNTGTGWEFAVLSTGNIRYVGNNASVVSSGASVLSGNWVHVAMTKSGNAIKLYINGTERGSGNANSISFGSNPAEPCLGCYDGAADSPNYKFQGLIDEVAFFKNRVLTAGEVGELYNSGVGLPYPFSTAYATADFNYTIDKTNTQVILTDASVVSGEITAWTWKLDDTNIGYTEDFNYTTTQLTDLNIGLRIDTNDGVSDTKYYKFNTGDWQAPTTFATAAQISGYTKANIQITCTDNNSGCNKVYYRVDAEAWADTNVLPIDYNYLGIGTHTLYWYGVDVAGNIEDTNSIGFIITGDNTAPTITFSQSVITPGFVNDFNVGLTLTCFDNRLDDINYIITKKVNGGTATTIVNIQDTNGTPRTFYNDLNIGGNQYFAKCIDYNGNQSGTIDSNLIYAVGFRLINEETGASVTDLNLLEIQKLQAFTYDGNNVYDYNIYSAPTKYFIDYDNVVRFDFTYNDALETKLSREIDFGLLPDTNIGLCAAPFQSFYEQFFVSSVNKDVVVYNDFAKCYNLASTTKFAYENALMVRAFTINKPYYLYTWVDDVKTLLATIDGSKASVINLDVLEFNKETYSFEIATDTVVFKCVENSTTGKCDQNTIAIYYKSLRGDNASVELKIYLGTSLLYEFTEEDEPNEFNLNWYYGGDDLNTNNYLKLVLTKTNAAGSSTTNDYWFNLEGQQFSGTLDASIAIIFSFLLLFVGLTLVAYRYAFGWFGIVLCVIAIAMLSVAPGFWYVQFMQAIIVIVAVFIAVIFSTQTKGVN